MRSSLNKKGFTQVDHITFDLILPTLSLAAQSILLRIYRQTAGWKKRRDAISASQFRDMTGIYHRDTIRRAITELEDRKLIKVIRDGTKTREFEIDWDTLMSYFDEEA